MHNVRELPQKTLDKIEKIAAKVVDKTLARKLRKMDLPSQVRVARRMVRFVGVTQFRANFLKDSGFPSDIKEHLKAGLSKEEIKDMYWGCAEFREWWKEIELTEENLDYLLEVW